MKPIHEILIERERAAARRFNLMNYRNRKRSLQATNRKFLKLLEEEQKDQDEEREGTYR